MVIICLGYMHYGKILDALYTERQDSVSNLADFIQESFSGIRVIKAFVRKQAEILSFSKKNQDTMDKSMRIAKLEAILEDYKKEGKSVYTPSFIEDNEEKVKALQAEYGFEYTIELK